MLDDGVTATDDANGVVYGIGDGDDDVEAAGLSC